MLSPTTTKRTQGDPASNASACASDTQCPSTASRSNVCRSAVTSMVAPWKRHTFGQNVVEAWERVNATRCGLNRPKATASAGVLPGSSPHRRGGCGGGRRASVLVLDWLESPVADRAVRVARNDGGWSTRPYPELAPDVHRAANQLHALGVRQGRVVSLLLADPGEFAVAFFGTLLAGCTPSPIATPIAFRKREHYVAHVAGVLAGADPAAVLTDGVLHGTTAEAAQRAGKADLVTTLSLTDGATSGDAPRRAPADLALLQYTSGSTGHPKGVRVRKENLEANLTSIRRWVNWGPDDDFATWLPVYHDMGLIGALLTPVVSCADLWIMTPDQFVRSPIRWLERFGTKGVTMTTSPSFGYAYSARRVTPEQLDGFDFSRWRVAIIGAERIDPTALADFAELCRPYGFSPTTYLPAYGLAEATLAVTGVAPETPGRTVRLGRPAGPGEPVEVLERGVLGVDRGGGGWLTGCGPTLEGLSAVVVDEQGVPVPDGVVGEIVISGDSVAEGYRLAGGELRNFPAEGFDTGDAGLWIDGELYVLGRIGDSLKVRGRGVFAEDLEAELTEIPGVKQGRVAVVFGATEAGPVAAALVESDSADWADEVIAVLRAHTAETVTVTAYRGRRGSIPRTSSGKPRRRIVWTEIAAGTLDGWDQVGLLGEALGAPVPAGR